MNRLLLLALVALPLACGDLKDLLVLQQGLAAEFKAPSVSVAINNRTHLRVTFTNSKLGQLPDSELASLARRVAGFVRDHYAAYSTLEDVSVGFAQSSAVGPISYTTRKAPYSFTVADLGTPHDSAPPSIKQ